VRAGIILRAQRVDAVVPRPLKLIVRRHRRPCQAGGQRDCGQWRGLAQPYRAHTYIQDLRTILMAKTAAKVTW
jgi:hypothetical protein